MARKEFKLPDIGEGIADADAGNLGTPTELMAEMDTLFTELRQPRG